MSVTPSIPVALATTPAYVATGETVEEFSAEIWLEKIEYPDNPHLIISSRFTKLRRQNNDIVGWLNIDGVLDEAVVQKDNEYYLRRDYRGYHNSNGAVFLEQTCDLRTRPYTIMLYAHNMKSGAMFGVLRNYENITYYRNAPFITFDTVYEDGIYVIFSVASLSLNNDEYDYFDFAKLDSRNIAEREEMIRLLKRRSIFQINIDVIPSDQLLMLVTCTGDSEERRVITARRLRPDETKESLLRIVQKSRKSNVCVR